MNDSINNANTIPPDKGDKHRASLNPGDTLGQYKVLCLLGRGGMGEVYEVEHSTLERRYALKLLPAEFANRADAVARFRREARVMANLDHPNIIKVDDFGDSDGRYWLRMELAEGGMATTKHTKHTKDCRLGLEAQIQRSPGLSDSATLGKDQQNELCPEGALQQPGTKNPELGTPTPVRTLEDYATAQGGRLAPDEARVIFTEILEGLAYAHSHGIVHRDLKPSNILICTDDDGNATFKISDFGLVRMVGEEWLRSQAEASVRLSMSMGGIATQGGATDSSVGTSTRSMLGTFEYMSPEQKRGEDTTAASDVYAVGLMMYRLLTGKQVGPRPPSYYIAGLDPAWDDMILTALEEDAGERFADASAMLKMLGKKPSRRPESKIGAVVSDQSDSSDSSKTTGNPTADNVLGMEFVEIAPGSFEMGSTDGGDDEKPVHTVRISQPFWMGKFPVTQGEYEKLTGNNPSFFKGEEVLKEGFLGFGRKTIHHTQPNHPVELVNWSMANEFCEKLTERERSAGRLPSGYEYRLPTEAEWEYAARGGNKSRGYKYAGSDKVGDVAWYDNNSGNKTHEVGGKRANELGIYDMSGNVWEWCYDWYDSGYYGKSPGTDPVNTNAASLRVLRGGSWFDSSRIVRSANRDRIRPVSAYGSLGFRVCLAPRIRE